MNSSRSTFRLLVAVISLACAGLIWLQVRFLLNTAELKRSSFEESVRSAMARSASAILDMSVMDKIFMVEAPASVRYRSKSIPGGWVQEKRDSMTHVGVITGSNGSVTTQLTHDRLSYTSDRPQRITIQMYSILGKLDSTLVDRDEVVGRHTVSLPPPVDQKPYMIRFRTSDGMSTMRVDPGGRTSGFSMVLDDSVQRERTIRRVVESFEGEIAQRPFRISHATLDSLVKDQLEQQSITLPFSSAIVRGDSAIIADSVSFSQKALTDGFRLPVGHFTPFGQQEDLLVHFPTMSTFLIGQLTGELGLSVLLIGVIIWCFAYSLRTLTRQQEFSIRLTDFINNMTHEFKTPVSTVGLASEALERPDVLRSRAKLKKYNTVIRDENQRMRSQIDRILQMASLEEGDIAFRRDPLSLHQLIRRVSEAVGVQVASRGGSLSLDLSASDDQVLGDSIHLENVLHNLLDNGLKYSPDSPVITIRTEDRGSALLLTVSDKGIGIDRAYLDKVFDKYFRVPTGNVHDVKGFGLGLSYVKLVVERHGGTAEIEGTPGQGTTVTLRLPRTVARNS